MSLPGTKITVPNMPDEWLIDNLVRFGQPRRIANMLKTSPQLKLLATVFYFDVVEMENGDPEAKLRVDLFRHSQQQLREQEKAIGNDPEVGAVGGARGRIGTPEPVTRAELHRRAAEPRSERPRPRIILPPGVRPEQN